MEATNLGFGHFIAQADTLSKSLLVILIGMSLISWSVIVIKLFEGCAVSGKNRRFLKLFRNANNIQDIANSSKDNTTDYGILTKEGVHAVSYYTSAHKSPLIDSTSLTDFLTITLRNTLDTLQMKKENGLSILATIAATAPFIGLFGTVWGIYHALISISASGAGTIDKVAGPVGEALIMTGIGLAVAIPAVIAYNWLSRRNRVAMGRLDSFAFELLTTLSSSQSIK